MASFPTLRSGRVATYDTEQSYKFRTGLARFVNGSEQRWSETRRLFEGNLVFKNLTGYDRGLVQEFFNSMKGQKDTTWDVTIDGVTWSYMTFTQDEIQWSAVKYDRFNGSVRVRQVRKN